MNILAIDTATPALSCALWSGDGPLASFSLVAGRRHAEVLMPAVDDLLGRAGMAVGDLGAVAVDHGPGLFTGLRVGLATAGAISQALNLPCAGVSSLDVLAHQFRHHAGLVAALVDARRGEVFWALFQSDGANIEPLMSPEVSAPAVVADHLAVLGPSVLAVGDGAWRYRGQLAEACVELAGPAQMWPRADVVAELGGGRVGGRSGGRGHPAPRVPAPGGRAHRVGRSGWSRAGAAGAGGARAMRTNPRTVAGLVIEADAPPPPARGVAHRAAIKPQALDLWRIHGRAGPGHERYYVVAGGGQGGGYGGLMFVADEAHITNIAVAPGARRQGIGSRLLAHLVGESFRRQCGP